jgi:hypothetical protein
MAMRIAPKDVTVIMEYVRNPHVQRYSVLAQMIVV